MPRILGLTVGFRSVLDLQHGKGRLSLHEVASHGFVDLGINEERLLNALSLLRHTPVRSDLISLAEASDGLLAQIVLMKVVTIIE